MKILIISTNSDEAGAPRHVETIVNGLVSHFQFILVFGEDGPVSQRLKNRGHIVHIVKEMRTAINPFKDFVALVKVTRLVKYYRPDVIHCHSAKAGMLGRLAAFVNGKRWLYTVHGWGWRGVSILSQKLIILIEFFLSRLPRGFYIFVAQDVMKESVDILKFQSNKGVVIYNGVPLIESNLPASNNPLVILMPARVSSAKDHRTLISAFELINDDNLKLLFCGAGTETEDFIDFAKSLAPNTNQNISFLGQCSDMGAIFSKSHIVALISNFEALPLSIIEAMSCSRAIIASNVGGVPELITSGLNGILVRPNSVDDIVYALHKCKDEQLRLRLGAAAKLSYEEKFTEKSMLTSISKTYRSLGVEEK